MWQDNALVSDSAACDAALSATSAGEGGAGARILVAAGTAARPEFRGCGPLLEERDIALAELLLAKRKKDVEDEEELDDEEEEEEDDLEDEEEDEDEDFEDEDEDEFEEEFDDDELDDDDDDIFYDDDDDE